MTDFIALAVVVVWMTIATLKLASTPLDEAGYYAFKDALPEWSTQLLAMLMLNTGCRISEVLKLTPAHCRLAGPEYSVLVQRSKTRQRDPDYEELFINPNLGLQLRNYIDGNKIGQGDRIWPMTYKAYWAQFKKAGVRPHELRGLATRILYNNGANMEVIANYLGHKNVETTRKHYYALTRADRKAIGERMPV